MTQWKQPTIRGRTYVTLIWSLLFKVQKVAWFAVWTTKHIFAQELMVCFLIKNIKSVLGLTNVHYQFHLFQNCSIRISPYTEHG